MVTQLVQQGSPSPSTRRKRKSEEVGNLSVGSSPQRLKVNEGGGCASSINSDNMEDRTGSSISLPEAENRN